MKDYRSYWFYLLYKIGHTGAISKTPCALSQEQINKSATILANVIIDFIKNGGNVKDVTPQNVFGRRNDE